MYHEANKRIQKLEKRFKGIKKEYMASCRILMLCKEDIKRMYNTEHIRLKQEKIERLEKQIKALDEAGRKVLDELETIKRNPKDYI